MEAIIVNKCDAWKSYASFDLVGVFTDRKKLLQCLKNLEKSGEIKNDTSQKIQDMTVREMHSNLEFISLEQINLNEVQ